MKQLDYYIKIFKKYGFRESLKRQLQYYKSLLLNVFSRKNLRRIYSKLWHFKNRVIYSNFDNKAQLDYLEMPLIDSCNLNCKGCLYFSQITDGYIEPLSKFSKNLTRLSLFISGVKEIRFLGGEPFLNKNIIKYCKVVKKCYPDSNLWIISNGLLIPKISNNILKKISRLDVGIFISLYPPTKKILSKIEKKLKVNNVSFCVMPEVKKFKKYFNMEKSSNPDGWYYNCESNWCSFFHRGYLSVCACPYVLQFYINKFKNHFDSNLNEKYLDIKASKLNIWKEDLTSKEIVNFLNTPKEVCRYCKKREEFNWESGTTPHFTDWIVSNNISE